MTVDTYAAVRQASEGLALDTSRGTWGMADAVLDYLPAEPQGNGGPGRKSTPGGAFGERLTALAERLTADGALNPRGEPWTAQTLDNLRAVAAAWSPAKRMPEASYTAHREAMAKGRQPKLAQLVAYARGQAAPDVTQAVADRIDARKVRGARFVVCADDLRLLVGNRQGRWPAPDPEAPEAAATPTQVARALADPDAVAEAMAEVPPEQRQQAVMNVLAAPTPTQDPEQLAHREEVRQRAPSTLAVETKQLKLVYKADRALRAVVASFQANPPHPDSLTTLMLPGLRDRFAAVELAATGGATDDALAALLATEAEGGQR